MVLHRGLPFGEHTYGDDMTQNIARANDTGIMTAVQAGEIASFLHRVDVALIGERIRGKPIKVGDYLATALFFASMGHSAAQTAQDIVEAARRSC